MFNSSNSVWRFTRTFHNAASRWNDSVDISSWIFGHQFFMHSFPLLAMVCISDDRTWSAQHPSTLILSFVHWSWTMLAAAVTSAWGRLVRHRLKHAASRIAIISVAIALFVTTESSKQDKILLILPLPPQLKIYFQRPSQQCATWQANTSKHRLRNNSVMI